MKKSPQPVSVKSRNYVYNYLNAVNCFKNNNVTTDIDDDWDMLVGIFNSFNDAELNYINAYAKWEHYKTYLNTEYWRIVSGKIKKDKNYTCERCGSKSMLEVHHKTYKINKSSILGWEIVNMGVLEVLCNTCHKNEHGIEQNVEVEVPEFANLFQVMTYLIKNNMI